MAVKHKVVECTKPKKTDSRLDIILRALQNNPGVPVSTLCEQIVIVLGTIPIPTETKDYMTFMKHVKTIQEKLIDTCSTKELILLTLKTFYKAISDSAKNYSPTMSIVLQLIEVEDLPEAVKWIFNSGYSEQGLHQALLTLCQWLCRWTWTANLGPLVHYFMKGLQVEQQHHDILVDVTLKYIKDLFHLMILPEPRKSVGPVVMYMLSSMQHTPAAFHTVIPLIGIVLISLEKENSDSSLKYLQEIVSLTVYLMKHFPDYPSLYEPLRQSLESFSPLYKQSLDYKSWSNVKNPIITVEYTVGKVGLNNLGNTCYMNSVLQALFMTKMFRNDILLSQRDTVPLLPKLQVLFTLLQYSQRHTFSPNDILNLARPPGFEPGHQHDSSEFLGHLLDVLHEQEKTIYVVGDKASGSTTTDSSATTIVQHSFGGKTLAISKCGSCGTQSERVDHFRDLQLSFPSNNSDQSVQTLLEYYLQPEKLAGDNQYHCDKCHGLTDGERITRIVEPPSRLILTLKHFRYNPTSHQRTKILQRIELNESLHLNSAPYDLYAVVVHCGSSVDSGHYYTFAHDSEDWYKFNDCIVLRTTTQELCGLKSPETPYILFYSRRDCVDPEPLSRLALSPKLEAVLRRDSADLENELQRSQIKTFRHNDDEPPPPGCGGGGFSNDSIVNRYVC